jgi:purine-cytosine permease-like protein
MNNFWNWRQSSDGQAGLMPAGLDPAALSEWIRARRANLPQSRFGRTLLGILFVFGGLFSFLPVLGIWMLPLGLVILSVDWPFVRRRRRQAEVSLTRWWKSRQSARA